MAWLTLLGTCNTLVNAVLEDTVDLFACRTGDGSKTRHAVVHLYPDRPEAEAVIGRNGTIPCETIQALVVHLPRRISAQPSHQLRRVEAITVVVQARLDIQVLRAEAVAEGVSMRAGCRERAPEGVIGVLGGYAALFTDVVRSVAVVIKEREVS